MPIGYMHMTDSKYARMQQCFSAGVRQSHRRVLRYDVTNDPGNN